MSPDQRFVMVAALLTGLRAKDDGKDAPADVVVDGFEAAMDNSCGSVPSAYGVRDIAVGIYITQRAHWLG